MHRKYYSTQQPIWKKGPQCNHVPKECFLQQACSQSVETLKNEATCIPLTLKGKVLIGSSNTIPLSLVSSPKSSVRHGTIKPSPGNHTAKGHLPAVSFMGEQEEASPCAMTLFFPAWVDSSLSLPLYFLHHCSGAYTFVIQTVGPCPVDLTDIYDPIYLGKTINHLGEKSKEAGICSSIYGIG